MGGETFEDALERNPLRGFVRDIAEVKGLSSLMKFGQIGKALHVACGDGSSTELVAARFNPREIWGTDRDPAKISAAKERFSESADHFSAQEITSLEFADESFDAVIDLAELHNLTDWRKGISEIRRVLKPGGIFFVEELSRESFSYGVGRIFKRLTTHPYETMFGVLEFYEEMEKAGFKILALKRRNTALLFKYFFLAAEKV